MRLPLKRSGKLFLLIAVLATGRVAISQQASGKATHPSAAKQSQKDHRSFIEVTEQDFTKAETLRSTNLTVFGIRLGQPEKEAVAAVAAANLAWKVQTSGNVEIQDSAGNGLIVMGITDGEVEIIGLQSSISEYLKGDAKKLFSPTILAPQSSFRMAILGHEDERKEGEITVVYTYFKEGIEIQGITNLGPPAVIVTLFVPAKSR